MFFESIFQPHISVSLALSSLLEDIALERIQGSSQFSFCPEKVCVNRDYLQLQP
jgi:hypothetical protein